MNIYYFATDQTKHYPCRNCRSEVGQGMGFGNWNHVGPAFDKVRCNKPEPILPQDKFARFGYHCAFCKTPVEFRLP